MLVFSNGGAKAAKTKAKKKTMKMGRLTDAVDVRSKSDVAGFEKLLEKGPLTLVLVYADWCGACHRFKENKWNNVLSMKNRTMNISSVREDMLPETSLADAKVPHYPTLMLVGKDKKPAEFTMPNGNVTNALPPEAKENVTKIVQTPVPELPEPDAVNAVVNEVVATPVAEEAPIATPMPASSSVNNALPPSMNSDLQQSIQNATAVASTPTKNIVGGGLFSALQKIAKKSTTAFKLRRKRTMRKRRRTLRKRTVRRR